MICGVVDQDVEIAEGRLGRVQERREGFGACDIQGQAYHRVTEAASTSSAAILASSASRSPIATFAPARAKASAVARPIPRAPR